MSVLSLGEEIATYLQGQSLSTPLNYDGSGAVNLFVGLLPDEPDVAVAVLERGGRPPIMVQTGSGAPESKMDQPRFQIRVRAAAGRGGYDVGNALIQSIFAALQGIEETVLNPPDGQLFHLITAVQSPAFLGRGTNTDARQRPGWAQNYEVIFDNDAR